MGGGGTTFEQLTPPQAPSASSSISEYIANYPQLFNLQQQYAPQEAQQQLDLLRQYGQPTAEAYKAAQSTLYPQETAIRGELGAQALQGMSGQLPDWARQSYLDTVRSNLGTNAGSPIGADYTSRGLMQQQEDWRRYYQNLGASLSGSQPVFSASMPQTTNVMSGYTPNSILNYNSSNYGNYANAYSSMYGANARMAGSGGGNAGAMGSALGMGIGALLAAPTGGMSIPMGAMIGGGIGGAGGSMIRW